MDESKLKVIPKEEAPGTTLKPNEVIGEAKKGNVWADIVRNREHTPGSEL